MESDAFWDLYWEVRLKELQNQGKKEAILSISKTIRQVSQILGRPLRLLELGCGEGQIIGALVEGHAQLCSAADCIGVDYLPASLQAARRAYPAMTFQEGDFTSAEFIEKLGSFDIVMLVNALHEVFSSGYSTALGEVDIPVARQRAAQAFSLAASRVIPGGYLALFDGLEPPGDPRRKVRLRFLSAQSFKHFQTFVQEYHPFRIAFQRVGSPYSIEMTQRDFTRYITKSIFLGKQLWQKERLESYQYYTKEEFQDIFDRCGFGIETLRTLTVDEEKWARSVEIETPGITFPEEHILIIARKKAV